MREKRKKAALKIGKLTNSAGARVSDGKANKKRKLKVLKERWEVFVSVNLARLKSGEANIIGVTTKLAADRLEL